MVSGPSIASGTTIDSFTEVRSNISDSELIDMDLTFAGCITRIGTSERKEIGQYLAIID